MFLFSASLWAQNGPSVWVATGLERVGLSDPARRTTTAQLSAARGEYESFQIVVRASGSGVLSNVTVTVSDLTNPTGQSISKANVEMFREQYDESSTCM